MNRKNLRLSQYDVEEVDKFRQYLEDMKTMSHEDFYRKYQEYMGLSDVELQSILDRKRGC